VTLEALMDKVVTSHRDDWHVIVCWGANTGPTYREQFTFYETWNSDYHGVLENQSHSHVCTYKADVSITLSFGLGRSETFTEEWANGFPDSHASSSWVDVFYNNALVFRDFYVEVDGGRAKLPIPRRKWDEDKKNIIALEVPKPRRDFIRLVDSFESGNEFEHCFKDAGFKVVNEPWPDLRESD
jgi:hypothetical protein